MLLLTLLAPLALADPPLAIPPAPDLDAVAVPSEPPKTLSAALADYRRRSVSLRAGPS